MTAPLLIPIADLGIKHADARPAPHAEAAPCLLCARWILHPREARYLEITTDGRVAWPVGAGPVPNSQGAFPVGPDCYKVVKKAAYLRLYTPTPRQSS